MGKNREEENDLISAAASGVETDRSGPVGAERGSRCGRGSSEGGSAFRTPGVLAWGEPAARGAPPTAVAFPLLSLC